MLSKNRFNFKTGAAGKIVFDPVKYILKEELTNELMG
jgi:hypothetical protein